MRTRDSILISLLAATDAAWLPSRESHGVKINSRVTSVYEARKRFREAGVPWASGGTSDAERKEIQRALEDLKESGDVIATKPNGSKTLFAKLSDDAYDRTRRECNLLGFDVGFLMLKAVALCSVRPATVMQHVWIPETKFNNGRGWGDGNQNELFIAVSQRALPALAAGWLDTQCDSQRHVYYFVTELGWQLIDADWRPSAVAAIHSNLDTELAYWNQLTAERSKLATRTPEDDGELGWLPLPVCHHNIPYAG